MKHDEVIAKLREYEEAGGDDAVLPAVLRALLDSNQQHADKLTKLQKAVTEGLTAIQQEQKTHAETMRTRMNVAITLVVIGAAAALASVLMS